MNIEEYFDFLAADDIRIKGTRIGIETVLYEYLYRDQPPEQICKTFPSLTLAQAYATILYYLQHQDDVRTYMADWLAFGQKMRAEQAKNPPAVVTRLRQLKRRQQEHQPV